MTRKSHIFLLFSAIGFVILGCLLVQGAWRIRQETDILEARKKMVAYLGLTDLCLFTDARYVRHLSQADHHTPFQDHPVALDHFPSGSLVPPPRFLGGKR